MAVTASVKFVQGVIIGTPAQALFGILGALVTVSNGNNANVARWKFEILDVPPGSAVPTGTVQDGALSTYSFTPDVRGGYLFKVTVYSAGNVDQSTDARCFGVKAASGRFIPPFTPRTELGDTVLNFGGQVRGWAKYMEEWLNFLDSLSTGSSGIDAKDSCRLGTTVNITLSGLQTIDGVLTNSGDRVLVKNQTLPATNGIYNAAAGAWTRSTDADTSAEVTAGMFTWITEGTTLMDTGWLQTNIDPIVLGVTPLTFVQFSSISGLGGDVIGAVGATQVIKFTGVAGIVDARATTIQSSGESTATRLLKSKGYAELGDYVAGVAPLLGLLRAPNNVPVISVQLGLDPTKYSQIIAIDPSDDLLIGQAAPTDPSTAAVANVFIGSKGTTYVVSSPNGIVAARLAYVATASGATSGVLTLGTVGSYLEVYGGGPQVITSVGAPLVAVPDGSIALRTNGTDGTNGIYTRQGGVWYGVSSGFVPTARTITAGAGLTGGGDLSADRTIDIVANADGSIVVNADDIQVGVLATDAQHGNLGGGPLHADVVPSGASGFMSGVDKSKLDGISPSAAALTLTPPEDVTKSAAVVGVALDAARADHKHDISTDVAIDITTANAEGSATSLSRSDHAHNLPFATVQTVLAGATGDISVNNQKITNLATPTTGLDAANKAYVDAAATGLVPHASCVVIATSAITLSGPQTIDGVGVIAGNRVLVAGQGGSPPTTDIANGIYVVAAGAWARAADLATGAAAHGSFVFVTSGTTNGGSSWICTNSAGSDIVDTDALGFTQFAGTVVAGAGLTKTGDTINVIANADGSITVNPDDIQVGILATDAQHGVRGGGTQHALVVALGAAGFMSGADKDKLDGLPTTAPPTTRNLIAGTGLTGGGDLSADRTFNVGANPDGSIIANANDVQVGILATDAQHGVRGGGTQHALVIAAGAAGFMSGTDKTKLDGIAAGAPALTSSAPANVTKSAAVVGVATTAARADHKHDIFTGVDPVEIQDGVGPGDEGTSTALSRADHVHYHGALGGGSDHALVTPDLAGFMSSSDKTKLDSISASAAAVTGVAPADVVGGVAVLGVSTTAARGDHQHHLPFSAVQTALGAATGAVGVNSQLVSSVALAITDGDAANKQYVDTTSKLPVRVVSTTNIALTGAPVIDGVAVVANSRVLVAGQTTASQNGIYVSAAGAWSRSADFDTSAKTKSGMVIMVAEGTANAHSIWMLTTTGAITLGTTALAFLKIAGGGANKLLQTQFIEVTADTTTLSAAFVAFDTITLTFSKLTATSYFVIHFSCGASNSTNAAVTAFRVRVDGVAKRGIGLTAAGAGAPSSGAIVLRVPGLAAGSHTVDVQWRVTSGTGRCRPATSPDSEHGSLYVEEVEA